MSNYSVNVNPTLIDPDGTSSLHGGKLGECIHLMLKGDDDGNISGNYTYEQLLSAFESDVSIHGRLKCKYIEDDGYEHTYIETMYDIDHHNGLHYFSIRFHDAGIVYLGPSNVYTTDQTVVVPK